MAVLATRAGSAIMDELTSRRGLRNAIDAMDELDVEELHDTLGHLALNAAGIGDMLAALKWARTCVPPDSDCHRAIVAVLTKAGALI